MASWWEDKLQDSVRLQGLERLDLVDARALQNIVYQYSMEELGGLLGKSSGCLSQPRVLYEYPPAGPVGGYWLNIGAFQFVYTYEARRSDGTLIKNEAPAGANALNPDDSASAVGHSYMGYAGNHPENLHSGYFADELAADVNEQTFFTQIDEKQKAWKSVVITHDPSDSSQDSRINIDAWMASANAAYLAGGVASLYETAQSPFLWARPVLVDTDTDSRREWDVVAGAEQAISINTRTRVRVEFEIATTKPSVTLAGSGVPILPTWCCIGRLWNWALGTRWSDGGVIGPQDPQLWPISAWDGQEMWSWVKTFGSGIPGEDDLTDATGLLGFPIPGVWLSLVSSGTPFQGNISASGNLFGGSASAGDQNSAYDESDLGLVKILGLMRKQLLRLNSWNEQYDWDTVGEYHSRGVVELNVWTDEVWDRTGSELKEDFSPPILDMYDDDGYLPQAYDVLYALARSHSFRYWSNNSSTLASAEYFAKGLDQDGGNAFDPRLFAGHPIAYARMVWDPVVGTESLGYWWLLYGYNMELFSDVYDSGQSGITFGGDTVWAEDWHKGLMNGGTGGPCPAYLSEGNVYDGKVLLGFSHSGTFIQDQNGSNMPRPFGLHSVAILPNTDGEWGRRDAYGTNDQFYGVGGGLAASNGFNTIDPPTMADAEDLWNWGGTGNPATGNSGGYGPWHNGHRPMAPAPSSRSWGTLPAAHVKKVIQSRNTATPGWFACPNVVEIETTSPTMSSLLWTSGDGSLTDYTIPGLLGPSIPVACSFDIVFFRHEDGTLTDEADGDGARVPSGGRWGADIDNSVGYYWKDGFITKVLKGDSPPF